MLKPRKKLTKRQMKEDKLVTYYFKSIDYIQQNSKLLAGVLLGIAAVIAVTYLVVHSRHAAETNASVELSKALVELENGSQETAADVLQTMINNFSGTKNAGRGVFHLANVKYEAGKYDEALKLYKQYVDDYGDDEILASSAYSGIGACYEQLENFETAAKFYLKGAEKFSKSFAAPDQLMQAARCLQLVNKNAQAKEIYQKVIDKYPDARQKRDAETQMNALNG
jgi:TolA-binding protein